MVIRVFITYSNSCRKEGKKIDKWAINDQKVLTELWLRKSPV